MHARTHTHTSVRTQPRILAAQVGLPPLALVVQDEVTAHHAAQHTACSLLCSPRRDDTHRLLHLTFRDVPLREESSKELPHHTVAHVEATDIGDVQHECKEQQWWRSPTSLRMLEICTKTRRHTSNGAYMWRHDTLLLQHVRDGSAGHAVHREQRDQHVPKGRHRSEFEARCAEHTSTQSETQNTELGKTWIFGSHDLTPRSCLGHVLSHASPPRLAAPLRLSAAAPCLTLSIRY